MLNDRLKDRDCIGFVCSLPRDEQAAWEDWMACIRRADKLVERLPTAFAVRRDHWESARVIGPPGQRRVREAWSTYLHALAHYHARGLVIRTVDEHDRMLMRLSGPLLQLAPGMPQAAWGEAAHLGALDQFYNNLRDMLEDGASGFCWLPEELLLQHSITRNDVIARRAPDMDEWVPMMAMWVDWHGSKLHAAADAIKARRLPPPIHAMLSWTTRRYERIRRVLVDVDYDYRRFPDVYWREVRRDLDLLWIDTQVAVS